MPSIREKMETLERVGLGYVKVGQQATTLSGGEAQRVKLSKELSRRATGRTLYILDEPTTGLHFQDVAKLLEVLHELVEQGNTVVVIEHNLEVIKTADWIIDFGPEGGDGGGEIVAQGPPEDIVRAKRQPYRPLPQGGLGAPAVETWSAGGRVAPTEPSHSIGVPVPAFRYCTAPSNGPERDPALYSAGATRRLRRAGEKSHFTGNASSNAVAPPLMPCAQRATLNDFSRCHAFIDGN